MFIFLIFVLINNYYLPCETSVFIERAGANSISKNCDNKPCYQGKCEGGRCRCFAGWGGQQCDHCYGRSLLSDESEILTDGPKNYSSSSRCMWMISNDVYNTTLLLRLDSFVTECSWDHVYVYDGNGVYGEQLAAFSGMMSGIELIVKSGKAVVYFFSDLAFNMPGFNISFSYGRCPANCSKNGICLHGVCKCFDGFIGMTCERRICAKKDVGLPNSKACTSSGYCNEALKCVCNRRFHGDNCQAPTTSPVFDLVLTHNEIGGRASYTSVLLNDSVIFVVGGTHFLGSKFSYFQVIYDISNSIWKIPDISSSPVSRYDHSLVQYKNKLFMFGGVIYDRNITNELWSFDLLIHTWTLEHSGNSNPNELPYAVAGHKAYVIGDEMFVFFGYNPYYGYVYRVQKYNLGTKVWSISDDTGPHIQGRFGHSLISYIQDKKNIILIYGGYVPSNEGGYSGVTNMLIEYKCGSDQCWHRILSWGIAPVFRHSASLLNGMMIVIGGNGHNESTSTRTNDCYSTEVQAYDIECDTWFSLSVNSKSKILERYGHDSVAARDSIYIFGGFNGTMLSDIIKFTPAKCKDLKRPDDCRNMHEGIRCVYSSGSCKPMTADTGYTRPSFFSKHEISKEESQRCPTNWKRPNTYCGQEKNCLSCISSEGCGWCDLSSECITLDNDNLCRDFSMPVLSSNICPKNGNFRPCSFAHECFSCRQLNHCIWYPMKDAKWKCIGIQEIGLEENHADGERIESSARTLSVLNTVRNASCPMPCSNYDGCDKCIKNQCMWCPTTRRCVRMDAYMISFPYGQCQSWITAANTLSNQRTCQLDPSDCSKQKTCGECQRVGPKCGWCDDGSGTGLGNCIPGNLDAPLNKSLCPTNGKSKWYFTTCSACQCNGHSNCTMKKRLENWIDEHSCTSCAHNTTGEHCQYCADGFFGDARNGGKCEECRCNGQATNCHRETGDCFCTTKGVTGRTCNKCDQKYFGDPENNQPCYYELTVDFIFTFKLDQDDPKDKYVNQINFFSIPHKRDTDVQFMVVCESSKMEKALVSMSINSSLFEGHPGMSKPLMARTICDENGIRRTYSANAEPGFFFGTDANTTFLVTIYNFSTPMKIQISFSQSPPINWILFFVIFAACFVVLLVVAGLLWMIKLRIEVFRRNQRRYDEIEQMASRPFASVRLELTCPRANLMATPISIEPCSNYRVGVFTLAVRLPTGGRQFTPYGTSGLALASTFCYLTQAQLGVLQAPETSDRQQNRKATLKRYIPFIRS